MADSPNTMEPSRIKGSQFTMYLCGTLVLIYFLFPHLFLLPYVLISGKKRGFPEWVDTFFWPVSQLAERIPAYDALLEAESNWTGIT